MKNKYLLISVVSLALIILSLGLMFADYSLRNSVGTGLASTLFPTHISYKLAPYSHVSIQKSCAGYYVSDFLNVTENQLSDSLLLQDIVAGTTGDGLPINVADTKHALHILGQVPDDFGKGEFGINYNGKSYFIKYEFTYEQKHYIDHVIGCYRDGLLSHFASEPVVRAFEKKYGNEIFRTASDDYVSFSSYDRDVYSARLQLHFDDDFNISNMSVQCYVDERDASYEITNPINVLSSLQNYHCLYDKYPYVKISINEFRSSYATGSTVDDFTIKLEGFYSTYNSPEIQLQDESGNVLWSNYDKIGHVYTSRTSPVDLCKEYRFYDIGGPITLNNTGTYRFVFSFEEYMSDIVFYVRDNLSGQVIDHDDFDCKNLM